MKILLLVTLFAFSTYSVTQASIHTHSIENGEGFLYLQYLSLEVDGNLEKSKENDVPFQEISDIRVPTPLELMPEPEKYTVVEGDNLYRIALNHNISLDSLASLNDLTGDLIHPGDVLIIGENVEGPEVVEFEPDAVTAVFSSTPSSTPSPTPSPPTKSDGKEMFVTATAYTAYCTGCSGTTAYGIDLRANPNQKVIAVDPKIIPLGTKVWVEGYGEAIAGDTGGAIKGSKIDVFIPSYDNAMEWGVKKVKIKILN
jgi:3D (Asp-Asp-Asp) domain-containing protein